MPGGTHHRFVVKRIRGHARRMRSDATDAEIAMWQLLGGRRFSGVKFRRQVPFRNYILDFICLERRLVIEIDGSQHLDSKRDAQRDMILAREGFRVARHWNNDVLRQRSAVSEDLFAKLGTIKADSSPGALRAPPSPTTRGECPVPQTKSSP